MAIGITSRTWGCSLFTSDASIAWSYYNHECSRFCCSRTICYCIYCIDYYLLLLLLLVLKSIGFYWLFTDCSIDFVLTFRSIWGHWNVMCSNSKLSDFWFFNIGAKSCRKRPQTIPKSHPNHPQSVPKFQICLSFSCSIFFNILLLGALVLPLLLPY